MATWVLRCKLYPEATPWRNAWSARPFRGGGLILGAILRLDRWLSRQNPAYRPVSRLKNAAQNASCHRDILRKAVSWSWTDSLGCPSFPFALICRIGNNASNVSKVDVDLLFCCFSPFFGSLVNYDLVYEGSQNLRR